MRQVQKPHWLSFESRLRVRNVASAGSPAGLALAVSVVLVVYSAPMASTQSLMASYFNFPWHQPVAFNKTPAGIQGSAFRRRNWLR